MYHKNFFSRSLSTLLFVVLLFNASAILAQDFITEWEFPNGTSQVIFNAQTNGEVHYSWSTASTSGQGHFTMGSAGQVTITVPAMGPNQRVRLSMEPANLRRFFIDDGLHKLNLKAVSQWGAVPWSSMNAAFKGCENFTITATDAPDLEDVTDMSFMFYRATKLNQSIGSWNTANVKYMNSMFFAATSFDKPIGNWNTAHVEDMGSMFFGAASFNKPIGNWNTSNVTDMNSMFAYATNFNQPIGNWNTANVKNMAQMFRQARNFNQPISNWNTANVTDMSFMFASAMNFNQLIAGWHTNNVTNMNSMFYGAASFNQSINNWNTAKVSDMASMFASAISFNQFIGGWNTASVTDMSSMFSGASSFNQFIGRWNTASVTDMSNMFSGASSFNQSIVNWNTANVTDMRNMFFAATSFNQPIVNWNTANVTNMYGMFASASSFDQNIGGWSLDAIVAPGLGYMLSYSGMSCEKYSATLIGWQANNPSKAGLTLGAAGCQYGTNAVPARTALTSPQGQGWTIADDVSSGSVCDDPDRYFITKWTFPTGTTEIKFNALTTNEPVEYKLTTLSGTTTGSFTKTTAGEVILTLPTVATKIVTLQMTPTNLRRFFIDNDGPHQSNLTEVSQWGAVLWSSMNSAFEGCENFTITATDIPNLNNVTDMNSMFRDATIFNQPLANWNTANVIDMNSMFRDATSFNQYLGTWNTEKVTDMNNMFLNATSFNKIIGNWKLNAIIAPGLEGMLSNSGLDCGNYSETLIGWRTNNPSVMGLTLGAAGRRYGTNAVTARTALTSVTGQDWTIMDDLPSGVLCLATEDPNTCCNSERAISLREASVVGKMELSVDETDPTAQTPENKESSKPNFKAYPNPLSLSNTLHVSVTGVALSTEAALRVRDIQGRIVHQQTLGNQTDVQLNFLSAGVYLLEATDGKAVWREKVVLTQ